MHNITIETERLMLRPLTVDDAQDVFEWVSDEQVARYMVYNTYETVEQVTQWLASIQNDAEENQEYHFGFVHKSDNKLIGSGSIGPDGQRDGFWGYGYNFRRDCWGNGYATEAARAMIQFAHDNLGANKFSSSHVEPNRASGRVMEKCGLHFAGYGEFQKLDGSGQARSMEYEGDWAAFLRETSSDLQKTITRITRMEQYFDKLTKALRTAPATLKTDATLRAKLQELKSYYENGQWLQDYEQDERGELPADLKRGVLSQDALYDLLSEIDQLTLEFNQTDNLQSSVINENKSGPGTYILTSMFPNGFPAEIAELFKLHITAHKKFAFVASEFERIPEKTDNYFRFFLSMFEEVGIHFEEAYVVDGRMTPADAQNAVAEADVVWLSGGDTPTQFGYFQKYGLIPVLQQHKGVLIGMSAGSINMAKTAICTITCEHHRQEIYPALGCVDISVEPHFDADAVTAELLELSNEHMLYGLCDNSVIICIGDNVEFYGEVYRLGNKSMERIH